jgi:ABC-type antimicrobial peptide transport system permease subunit
VLVSVFGLASLLLAVAGVYAVISYGVGQRSREIAIRMALGARSTDVLLLVVGQGMRSATLGVLVAIPGALAVTRGLESLLFGVAPTDPSAFAAAAIVLLATTLAACALPAMRATRVRASSLGAE